MRLVNQKLVRISRISIVLQLWKFRKTKKVVQLLVKRPLKVILRLELVTLLVKWKSLKKQLRCNKVTLYQKQTLCMILQQTLQFTISSQLIQQQMHANASAVFALTICLKMIPNSRDLLSLVAQPGLCALKVTQVMLTITVGQSRCTLQCKSLMISPHKDNLLLLL